MVYSVKICLMHNSLLKALFCACEFLKNKRNQCSDWLSLIVLGLLKVPGSSV